MPSPRTQHRYNVPILRGEKHDIFPKILHQAGFETTRQAVTLAKLRALAIALFSIYVYKIALWRDGELKYSPKDLHKSYIISKQKHIYYTFFYDSLHEGLAQLFCTRQVIIWSEKV